MQRVWFWDPIGSPHLASNAGGACKLENIGMGIWDGQLFDGRAENGDAVVLKPLEPVASFSPDNRSLAIMGWDGYFVLDDRVNIVDMAREYLTVAQKESCGRCVPCRMGTRVAADTLTRICEGRGKHEDVDALRRVAILTRDGSMCELGRTSMNALLSMLDQQGDAFREAIVAGTPIPRGTYHSMVTAPCTEACPERLDIPQYVQDIREGQYAHSLEVIQEKNPLASVCGRVCVRFCEFVCRRGQIDSPIDIRHLKRFVSDVEMDAALKKVPHPKIAAPRGIKIAVIGAGPAGVTAAYHLLQKGYAVDIFESQDEPGGMAAVGIPDYRLPRETLRAEIRTIQEMGAQIHYGQALGASLTLEDLRGRGYGAVFVAIGAQLGTGLRVEGEDLEPVGYMAGIDFLRRVNRHEPVQVGKKAIVVGGGNVAMDCTRSALRLGVEDVHLVYRRNREAMPADELEVHDAEQEGVVYHFLCNPTRLLIEGGALVGVECLRMRLGEPDASGRRRPIPIEGSEFVIDCDMVIPAIGQKIDVASLSGSDAPALTRWTTIEANPDTLLTNIEGVFAGGDCVSGPATLIEAMAAGLKASDAIDQYIREGRVELTKEERLSRVYRALSEIDEEHVDRVGGQPRMDMPMRPVGERITDFEEVELAISPEDALREANRCLRCYRVLLVATEK